MASERRRNVWAWSAAFGVMAVGAGGASAQCVSEWIDLPAIAGPARTGHSMAFDAVRGRAVMFGGWLNGPDGCGCLLTSGETWELESGGWVLKASDGPSPRWGASMVFHEGLGVSVLHGGGFMVAPLLSDSWMWNGSAWSMLAQGPDLSVFAMAYDSDRQRIVLHGGASEWGTLLRASAQTYEFDAAGPAWTLKATTGPSARYGHAMAYDKDRHRMVMFGGTGDAGVKLGDTWEWDGVAWKQMHPAVSPEARTDHIMVYDELNGKTVLYGGRGASRMDDTWEWDGVTWTRGVFGAPPARDDAAAAYNSETGQILMHGGRVSTSTFLADTWKRERRMLADLNGDGQVDFADYLEFLNLFEAHDVRVDFTQDGFVDFADYLVFLNYYDTEC